MADPNPRELAAAIRYRYEWDKPSIVLTPTEAELVVAALEKGADAIDALEAIEESATAINSLHDFAESLARGEHQELPRDAKAGRTNCGE